MVPGKNGKTTLLGRPTCFIKHQSDDDVDDVYMVSPANEIARFSSRPIL